MQYNKDWLSEQIIKNRDSMYRFALSIMKNHDDACDAVSEAILHAYVNIGSLCFGEKFRSWVMTILYNVCMNMLRSRVPYSDFDAEEKMYIPSSEADITVKSTLWDAVCALPSNYRSIVVLFYYDNLRIKEISNITGLSLDNVKKRLSRAREMLRKSLRDWGGENISV